jgi:hypothetical protein
MAFEGLLELIPSDSMSVLLHGLEIFPPHQRPHLEVARLQSMVAQRQITWPQ